MERCPSCLCGQGEVGGGCQSAFLPRSGGEGEAPLRRNRGHHSDRGAQTGEGTAFDRPSEVQTGTISM